MATKCRLVLKVDVYVPVPKGGSFHKVQWIDKMSIGQVKETDTQMQLACVSFLTEKEQIGQHVALMPRLLLGTLSRLSSGSYSLCDRECLRKGMWFVMESAQTNYELSDRLIRAISNLQTFSTVDDDIEQLIESGADVNRVHGTLLPLQCACMVSDAYCLQLLLEKGALVNAVDGYGRAALHYAAERDVCCVEVLIQHGANVNAPDGNNDTPLHWAAYKNNVDCVKLLLQHGALVDVTDYNLDTPLSWAARRGNLEVIQILLDYNANASLRNAKGYTPLMRAAAIVASGLETAVDDACLDLLIQASGQFDARTTSGELVSELARDNKVRETLLPLCRNPLRLSCLCRSLIRRCLGHCYMPNVVPKLPLPQQLHQFVLLNT